MRPFLHLDFYIAPRFAAAGENFTGLDKRQRFGQPLNFTGQQLNATRAAIPFPALIFYADSMRFQRCQQRGMFLLTNQLCAGNAKRNTAHGLQLEIAQVVSVNFRIDLTDQIGTDFDFLRCDLYVIGNQPGVNPWNWV